MDLIKLLLQSWNTLLFKNFYIDQKSKPYFKNYMKKQNTHQKQKKNFFKAFISQTNKYYQKYKIACFWTWKKI